MKKNIFWLLILFMFQSDTYMLAQTKIQWNELPDLPDVEGFAGMFAGTSGENLFCMGGANFPGKKPWEGGSKKWYSTMYMVAPGKAWIKLYDTLPLPLAYGVSVSDEKCFYIIGGSTGSEHSARVFSFTLQGNKLHRKELPELPHPLANMAGALVNDLIIVAGGSESPQGPPLKSCYGLDLKNIKNGWFSLPTWPGAERNLPVCAAYHGAFFLFSGERVAVNPQGEKYRHILQDAYKFLPVKGRNGWTGTWSMLAPLPQGASAAGTPLPVLSNGTIMISGGVDAVTALHTDPVTHQGITRVIQYYYPDSDCWQLAVDDNIRNPRVTLPVTRWNRQWVYISGEIKPGIRTNSVLSVKE